MQIQRVEVRSFSVVTILAAIWAAILFGVVPAIDRVSDSIDKFHATVKAIEVLKHQ